LIIDGVTHKLKSGVGILVPAGATHNLINTGDKPMKIYTIYGPPNHVDQFVQATKAVAEASSEHFDGKPTE
jgi:mannose-6-phosphate isomerase-like protein (cupin superfamily)